MMRTLIPVVLIIAAALGFRGQDARTKTERFDRDPGWEGVNNRATSPGRPITQNFGYSKTANAGGRPGEMGGLITPCGEAAYYAKRIPPRGLNEPLEASGKFVGQGNEYNVLIGFFNSGTVKEWRTPNSIALRFYGRGDVFYPYLEYATSRWRAGADSPGGFSEIKNAETGRSRLVGFAARKPHTWSLRYDPLGNDGSGLITAIVDGETAICHLGKGHKADGATFNRFGLLNVVKSADGGGEVWLDDVKVNGVSEDFSKDPGWDARGNRTKYVTNEVRQRFDFGYSPTHHAGGRGKGELGGLVYRGDDRSQNSMAYYADRVGPLRLNQPLHASGRVTLRRAVSDSTAILGFFNSRESMRIGRTGGQGGFPEPFLGIAIEGPSREGFFLYPAYNLAGERAYADGDSRPRILPNGATHSWSLNYDPTTGRIRVTLGKESVTLEVKPEVLQSATTLDRFGIITTTTDGNAQAIYFDDISYTAGNP